MPTKKRNRADEISKCERYLLKAVNKCPIVKVKESYWSPGTLRHFNAKSVERIAVSMGLIVIRENHGPVKITVIRNKREVLSPEQILYLHRQANNHPKIRSPMTTIPVHIPLALAKAVSEHGDLRETAIRLLTNYSEGKV